MNVATLIEMLSGLPQDAIVMVRSGGRTSGAKGVKHQVDHDLINYQQGIVPGVERQSGVIAGLRTDRVVIE